MTSLTRRLPLGVTHPTVFDRIRQSGVIAATVLALCGAVYGSGLVGGRPIPSVAGGALGPDATLLAPAGPAFEAAQIRCGMRAADGAIEGVKIDGDALTLQVIGDVAPVGICGSGVVDIVAELVHNGLLDHSGRFADVDAVADSGRPELAK